MIDENLIRRVGEEEQFLAGGKYNVTWVMERR